MSTDDQFAAHLRRIAAGVQAPNPIDADALSAVAVRRTRRRRVVVPAISAMAVVALATTVAFALPDAGRSPLPGGAPSSPGTSVPSASPEVSAAPTERPAVLPIVADIPSGWRVHENELLRFAVPPDWVHGKLVGDGPLNMVLKEEGAWLAEVVVAPVEEGGWDPARLDRPGERRTLPVAGAASAEVVFWTNPDDPSIVQDLHALAYVTHPEGRAWTVEMFAPGTDAGAALMSSILGTVQLADLTPQPAYDGAAAEVPADWARVSTGWATLSVPPELTVAEGGAPTDGDGQWMWLGEGYGVPSVRPRPDYPSVSVVQYSAAQADWEPYRGSGLEVPGAARVDINVSAPVAYPDEYVGHANYDLADGRRVSLTFRVPHGFDDPEADLRFRQVLASVTLQP